MPNIISIHGSHNGGIATYINDEINIIEFERFFNSKNIGLTQYKPAFKYEELLNISLRYINDLYNINDFDIKLYSNTDIIDNGKLIESSTKIKSKESYKISHHLAHADGVFYQSPYDKALVISYDGGGDDGFFNIYAADRTTGCQLIDKFNIDLGFSYMVFAHYIQEIQQMWLSDGNLVYSGKIMGLCSYGNVIEEWIQPFTDFYKSKPDGINYKDLLKELASKTCLTFDEDNRLSGQSAYDVAATSQRAFENVFFEIAWPYIKKYSHLPICLTGGCALNIILNSKLQSEIGDRVFVGPNSNDSGIAVGMLLSYLKPSKPVELMYAGIPLLDRNMLSQYIQMHRLNVSILENPEERIAKEIYDGKIVGVIRGTAEHGPRALGNRSILCNPSIKDMKDILNSKVKHREWFRPFAGVVPLDESKKYFNSIGKSKYMSFGYTIKDEWKDKLQAITHVDNTSRIQTVEKHDNEWLYNLLFEFKKLSGHSVILNTSFNVNGKPITSTISDAVELFLTSQMDCLVIDDNILISK